MARPLLRYSTFATFRRPGRAALCVLGALAFVCASPAIASASPGQIDPTFGHLSNGTILTDHGRGDSVVKVLHQSDGKIVAVANGRDDVFGSAMQVTRYLTNGSVDPSFGTNGTFTKPYIRGGLISDAALQLDGKIVIVGSTDPPSDFFILRLRANGTLDPTFVTAHPTTHIPTTRSDQAFGVALGPAGTIVVAGSGDANTAIARFTATGALDPTFAGDGLLVHDFGEASLASDVAVQSDGRIIVGGLESNANNTPHILLARFSVNGTIDGTYGSGGQVATTGSKLQYIQTVLLQGTNAVVSGVVSISTAGIARYDSTGTLDPTFGSGGTTLAHVNAFTRINDLLTDGSGRLVAVGEAAYDDNFPDVPTFTALFRYSANGGTDPSFGCFGTVLTQVLGNGTATEYNASAANTGVADGNDIVVGGSATTFNQTDFPPSDDLIARYDGDSPFTAGYGLLRSNGGTSAFGGAPACGSIQGLPLNAPIVGSAYDPAAPGNWSVATDGGVFTFGAAKFLGSMGAVKLNQPIVGMAAAPDGQGYWLVASDGGIYAFGSAHFFGSMGAVKLNQPVVGMAAAKDGKGYWLVASDGGVFAFGSAKFAGSMGAVSLNKPVVGIAADPDGAGYWMVAGDGGVFSFDAKFAGSTGAIKLAQPVVGIAADPDGTGYWMGALDGGIFAFDAPYFGSNGATPYPGNIHNATIGIAATPNTGPI